MFFSPQNRVELIESKETLALTPALSPEERERLLNTPECSMIHKFFQRWDKFSLSHLMGEGRGEGSLFDYLIIAATKAGSRILLARGPILLICLAANMGWAAPVALLPQRITLPANTSEPLFVDIDGDGRSDLLVLDPAEKKLSHYHQRANGFGNSPDQTIPLPPKTAWVAACDVDAHSGLELIFSTANGVSYSRQNLGLLESERRTLIESPQVFSNFDFPILNRLSTNKTETNILIPVISSGQIVLYHRNSAYEWSPEAPLTLDVKHADWSVSNSWPHWTLGPNAGHSLNVLQSFQSKPDLKRDDDLTNEAVRKISKDFQDLEIGHSATNRVDVNGDGREDLVLWHSSGKLDVKTDCYIFLRGADQKLPERPTQILHCRGFPIPLDSTSHPSTMKDLDGDGICELVLLELKTRLTSVSGAVETALSHGLDWALTIRSFRQGTFSRSPDTSFPVKGILPAGELEDWPLFILGDFNGDRRPELVFRRTETQWNIFPSTSDGRWFASQPALSFEAPVRGHIEINDLNGDGFADIIWREPEEHRLSIFMSPTRKEKKP